ncbi:hypothetical protein DMN91_002494 [Ooceraea biroi]|uniref:Cubilin n=1 Tax=Ooceraea biroi TaxID=2015173 RepID=A0A3L8DWF6_OOCBI|nr:hypothetical protein DMN91_002494 [Ooceraea biroi]
MGGGYVNVNEINLLHVASAAQNATRVIDRWQRGYLAVMENSLERLATIVTGPLGLQRRVALLERGIDANGTNRAGNRSRTQGPNCMTDVNECARFLGTDLGCQNRATCRNLPGSYRCDCLPGWFGLHCTQKTSICNAENSGALCGEHGVCVEKSGSSLGYTCICDQGWQKDGTNPACIKDVDECAADHPPCSVNPPVPCRNTLGSFTCGACPHGYSGNGYYCTDIDECLINNGGCSTSPYVQCMNTCIYVGGCAINNGGCHPLASCTENPSLTSSYVLCRCPAGYIGNGMGPNGCQIDASVNIACASNPCVYGRCTPTGENGFTCTCNPGYSGTTCNVRVDPCSPNPCRNNGVCQILDGQVTCQCRPSFTGSRCETPRQSCGGVSRNPTGRLQFPMGGSTYQHGLSCAWVLITEPSKVLNVTFSAFNLEHSTDCKFDFLQIHDGRNAGSQMINRFCGDTLPNGNGNIVSSHNTLYLWFHSDSSVSRGGFTFEWNSINPVCGGVLENNYGTISSPGSPGRYPPNRDCFWTINATPSKRIQFHFGLVMLEEHPTCESDYLEITGIDNERLGLFCNHTRPPPLITPSSEAEVHFHSDSAGQDAGFQIHYSLIEGVPGCGGMYTTPTGTISSPGHASSSYQPNMECEWKIQLPMGERIKASWLRFDLEHSSSCQFDFVEIFDGPTTESQLLGRYCGSDIPPTFKSNSNTIVVIFKSDWSYELEGFTLSYEALCGGEFHDSTGILKSPFYPNTYHGSRTCTYEIVQPTNKGIVLTIEDMDIEGREPPDCYYDYLEIYDGDNENTTKLATLCGDVGHIPAEPYYSTHNYMYIKFTTDSSIEGRGFKANYTTIDRRCGGMFKESNHVIQSPIENGVYANNEQCIWTIQAPPGYVIQLTWLSFNLEYHVHCVHDYVNIYENYTASEEDITANITSDGFVATYIFVDAMKVCGGRYMKSNGVIKSPNYPNYYPNKKECTWIIEAQNKHRIVLTVESFELEDHSSCAFDYLEIRNGGYESAPLIGKFCGCGGTMNTVTGDIMSPYYPELYQVNADCYWKIAVAAGSLVQLEIVDLDLEQHSKCRFDFIEVFEGISHRTNGRRYCGTTYPTTIQAKSNQMTVRFRSDFSTAGRGFHLKYKTRSTADITERCQYDYLQINEGDDDTPNTELGRFCGSIDLPKKINSTQHQVFITFITDSYVAFNGFRLEWTVNGCGGHLTKPFDNFTSPQYPFSYPMNVDCEWLIEVDHTYSVELTLHNVETEKAFKGTVCPYDKIQIYGGEDSDAPKLVELCYSDKPVIYTSPGNKMFVKFHSDVSYAGRGFNASYRSVPIQCGGRFTANSGVIHSANYPQNYPHIQDCEWLLEVDSNHLVNLTFLDFDIENSRNCTDDYVKVFDGPTKDDPLLGTHCHNQLPPAYISSSNQMLVVMRTDSIISAKGFKARYTRSCGARIIVKDHGFLTPSSDYITDHVTITFTHMEIDPLEISGRLDSYLGPCSLDYVQVFEGEGMDGPLLGKWCDNITPPPVTSTGSSLTVHLYSSNEELLGHFAAAYSVLNTACGGNYTSEKGAITSPGYPNSYPLNAECVWVLNTSPGNRVTLTFSEFDIQSSENCDLDYLEIRENSGIGKLISVSCGKDVASITSSSVLWIKFKSDSSGTAKGFVAEYNYVGGNELEGPSGRITSPLYPKPFRRVAEISWRVTVDMDSIIRVEFSDLLSECNMEVALMSDRNHTYTFSSPGWPTGYAPNVHCNWVFTSPPGTHLVLRIITMNLEESSECIADSVSVYSGYALTSTDNAKLESKLCLSNSSTALIKASNVMTVKFDTDAFVNKTGFNAYVYRDCGGELTGPNGVIEHENSSYTRGIRTWQFTCEWIVTVKPGRTIKVQIIDMSIQETPDHTCGTNSLLLKNGNGMLSPLLGNGKYCGNVLPPELETTGNQLYVKATGNGPYLNFKLTYNCEREYVEIRDGGTDGSRLMGRFCKDVAPSTMTTTGNMMYIYFYTDVAEPKNGFKAVITSGACGGSLTALSGIIKSPGYPHPRIRPRYCDWRIVLPMGYQVVVNILDLDIINEFPSTGVGYALTFYNDYRFKSKIKVLGQGSTTQEIKSSSNTMLIAYWSSVGHRGFKLRYSAQIPAPCGGNLREPAGNITGPRSLPFNESSYVCNWKLEPPESMIDLANNTGLTLTIKVSGFLGRTDNAAVQSYNLIHFRTYSPRNCFIPQYIVLQDIGIICRNLTEPAYLRSPKIVNELTMINGTYGKRMDVSLEYQWQSCGGILQGPSHTIKAPKNILYPVNCAWHIDYPAGDTFKLSFTKLQLDLNCDRAFFIIRNGEAMAPQIEKLCGHTAHSGHEINSISNQLWIEYFSSGNSSDFEFKTDIINTGCGGSLHGSNREISSPHFPKQYPNNSECTWEIMGDNGYHIGLAFVDRFSLETSHNCENDYVEVFDWIRKDGDYDNGEWRGLSKVCGRNSPPPFNSTSNRMKVIFHSNEAVRSDGFHAVWSENCGGIFQATERINIIQSPSYPGFYPSNAFCNYTIVAPNEDIIIEFTDFQLERGRSNCRFDNVTVITESLYTHYNMEDTEIYCDNKKPPLLRSLSKVQIIFMTDRYVQRTGFQFKYFINKCGGIITKPSELKPLMHGEEYFGRMNCTWIIKAPQGKSVLVRFEKFILEHSTSCYFDNVAVYEGDFVNPDKRLGLVCGNLTRNLPLFKSDSNSMVVNFNADSSRHFEGFTAKVLFVTSPADGCGETINMTSIQSKSFRTQLAATYQPFEECHWTVVTSPGKNIRLTINSMDIRNSINNTQSDKCTGDYLEVRDGGGLYAEMLGQYCGNVLPLPIVSVSNKLWIRLHTDGTAEGTGATATLDVIESLCGLTNRVINDTVKVLTSPGYPNTYSPGMKCRWTMRHVDEYHSLITARIRFTDFDMEDSNKCENEYVEISEHNEFISEGFGADFIYAGTMKHPVTVELGSRFPYTSYKYCGTQLPHEYYSYSNEFQVTFKSTSSGHKGFKLEYSTANCDRNYTSEQGRIAHHGFTSCWISITVPANRTISLYFVQFNLYDAEHCTHNALQVHDGDSSGPLITTLCNAGIPNPIFSTGNKLTLHSWTESANFYQNYDIIYTTTDAGRGCGGHIFNFGGRFTSPLYPSTYRNNTVCTWDVSVPRGFKIILQFLAFDIGTRRNCENNNVKFYDVVPEQLLRSTYCGGDDPARFEAETNRVLVEYASTVNNVGTGWVIAFMAQSMEHPVDIMDNWT